MYFIISVLVFVCVFTLILLDITGKINLFRRIFIALAIPVMLNVPLCTYWLWTYIKPAVPVSFFIFVFSLSALFLFYLWIKLNIFPVRDGKPTGIRLKAMIGGRHITYCALWGFTIELIILLILYNTSSASVPAPVLIGNLTYAAVLTFILFCNGLVRIFLTSRRLSILRRIVMLCTLWVPIVNFIVFTYACRLVRDEYDFACYKKDLHLTRAESDLCKTKYPLVFVHGIFFRDIKYFNYWGRIPKELLRNGASVYYGNQEAVGTISYNAEDICRTVKQILAETGCEKVNIIAHSKGGLDSRYAISKLGLARHIASLTTINTPHHGCRFVDKAARLPERLYRFIAKIFDNTFRKFGDKNPDFYTATHQFTTTESRTFNASVPDMHGVYYQSYMSRMSSLFSDSLLCLPYCLIKPLEGDNDGLVSVDSARWGEFRGVITSPGRRGISHGDIIDLKREDYNGFDITETYVQIVKDLKQKGF